MTIQGLLPFIRKKVKDDSFTCSLIDFKRRRIAIDTEIIMRSNIHTSYKIYYSKNDPTITPFNQDEMNSIFIDLMMKEILVFLSCYVTPIFCLDGIHPETKDAVKEKRREERKKQKEKLRQVEKEVKGYDILALPKSVLKRYKEILISNYVLTKEQRILFIQLCNSIGVPCLQASDEAERLCSSLCIYKVVGAIYSNDSDCLAYNCPVIITNYNRITGDDGYPDIELIVVVTRKIRKELGMTKKQFRAFCIGCGCDHNVKPGERKGPVYFYKQLVNENIDDLRDISELSKKQQKGLNYKYCDKMFKKKHYSELMLDDYVVYRDTGYQSTAGEDNKETKKKEISNAYDADEVKDSDEERSDDPNEGDDKDEDEEPEEDLEEQGDDQEEQGDSGDETSIVKRTEENKFDIINNLEYNGYDTLKTYGLQKYYSDLVKYYSKIKKVKGGCPLKV